MGAPAPFVRLGQLAKGRVYTWLRVRGGAASSLRSTMQIHPSTVHGLVAEWETAAVGSRHAVAVGETASARVSVSLWRVEGKGGLTSFSCGTGLEMSESDP